MRTDRTPKQTAAKAREAAGILGDDYTFTRDPQLAAERASRRRTRARTAQRRADRQPLWVSCIAPGCNFSVPPHLQNGVEFPICTVHATAIWESIELALNDRDPFIRTAWDALRARREVIRAEWRKRDEIDEAKWQAEVKSAEMLGDVYYARVGGLIKVGWTSQLHQRIRSYGADCELLAHYPGTRQDETNLHRQLKPSRAKGREWYHDDAIVRGFVAVVIRQHGEPKFTDAGWTVPKHIVAGKRHALRTG